MSNYMDKVPAVIKESLKRYVEQRVPTGGFLRAVLSNNLVAAAMTADGENQKVLAEIAAYVYWELPTMCWGSPDVVKKWLSRGE